MVLAYPAIGEYFCKLFSKNLISFILKLTRLSEAHFYHHYCTHHAFSRRHYFLPDILVKEYGIVEAGAGKTEDCRCT